MVFFNTELQRLKVHALNDEFLGVWWSSFWAFIDVKYGLGFVVVFLKSSF